MSESAPSDEVESPCIGVCVVDPASIDPISGSPLCLGCRRSLDEIASWASATAEQQREIKRLAALRKSNAS